MKHLGRAHVGCPVQPGGPVFPKQEKTIKSRNGEVLITPMLPAAGFICPEIVGIAQKPEMFAQVIEAS